MKFIDAHHHTWELSVFPYTWMDDPHPIGDISALKNLLYLFTENAEFMTA